MLLREWSLLTCFSYISYSSVDYHKIFCGIFLQSVNTVKWQEYNFKFIFLYGGNLNLFKSNCQKSAKILFILWFHFFGSFFKVFSFLTQDSVSSQILLTIVYCDYQQVKILVLALNPGRPRSTQNLKINLKAPLDIRIFIGDYLSIIY